MPSFRRSASKAPKVVSRASKIPKSHKAAVKKIPVKKASIKNVPAKTTRSRLQINRTRNAYYKTWTLFLVNNPEWFLDRSKAGLVEFYKIYHAFGEVIGFANVAIWFTETLEDDTNSVPSKTALNYDALRAAEYCMHYGLAAEDSPHVIVTSHYPDLNASPTDFASISLGGLDQLRSRRLLTSLVKQIYDGKLNQGSLDKVKWWARLETILRAWITSAAKNAPKINMKLHLGFLTLNVSPRKKVNSKGFTASSQGKPVA